MRSGFTPWTASTEHLDFVERVLEDCIVRGIDVMLTTAQLANNRDQGTEEAIRVGSDYVGRLAERFAPYAKWWQVLNEHDWYSWLDHSYLGDVYVSATNSHQRRPGMTDEYLETIKDVVGISASYIKEANPDCLVGTTTTGVLMDEPCEKYIWWPFYDVVGPVVDYIGINGYPTDWWRRVEQMPARIRRTGRRYDKPVILTETGLPSHMGSEEKAGEWTAHMIDRGTRSNNCGAVFVYQLRDTGTDITEVEQCFGVIDYDGNPKAGYSTVKTIIKSITS